MVPPGHPLPPPPPTTPPQASLQLPFGVHNQASSSTTPLHAPMRPILTRSQHSELHGNTGRSAFQSRAHCRMLLHRGGGRRGRFRRREERRDRAHAHERGRHPVRGRHGIGLALVRRRCLVRLRCLGLCCHGGAGGWLRCARTCTCQKRPTQKQKSPATIGRRRDPLTLAYATRGSTSVRGCLICPIRMPNLPYSSMPNLPCEDA